MMRYATKIFVRAGLGILAFLCVVAVIVPFECDPDPVVDVRSLDTGSGDWIIDYDPTMDSDPVKPEKPTPAAWMLGGKDADDIVRVIRTDAEGRCVTSPQSGLRIIVCHDDGTCQEVKP